MDGKSIGNGLFAVTPPDPTKSIFEKGEPVKDYAGKFCMVMARGHTVLGESSDSDDGFDIPLMIVLSQEVLKPNEPQI